MLDTLNFYKRIQTLPKMPDTWDSINCFLKIYSENDGMAYKNIELI